MGYENPQSTSNDNLRSDISVLSEQPLLRHQESRPVHNPSPSSIRTQRFGRKLPEPPQTAPSQRPSRSYSNPHLSRANVRSRGSDFVRDPQPQHRTRREKFSTGYDINRARQHRFRGQVTYFEGREDHSQRYPS